MLRVTLYIALLWSPADREPDPCWGPLDRAAVVECARANSPRIRATEARIAISDGEIDAARVMLPSNPTLAVTVNNRTNSTGDQAVNVSGTITQQLEIAGQRRKRRARRRAERDEARAAVEVTALDVEARALAAYFDVLAAREELKVIESTLTTSRRLEAVAQGRATAGLAAPMDVDLAAARRAELEEQVALAHGRIDVATAQLAGALGLDPTAPPKEVRGRLRPLRMPSTRLDDLTDVALRNRPELAALAAARRTESARVAELKRNRAPNPSLSFFLQTDGFDERVIGGGLSLPIPLPAPLGRTNRGKIAAARASVRRAQAQIDARSQETLMEVAMAFAAHQARRRGLHAYPDDVVDRARDNMADVSTEIEAGRLPVRDALIVQQALQDVLRHRVHAEHQLCRASVELARAIGLDLAGVDP